MCTSLHSLIECIGPVKAEPLPNPQMPTEPEEPDDTYEMDTDVCVRCGLRICGAGDVFGGFCLTCWQRDGCQRPPNVPDAGRWPPGYNLQRDPPATPTPADAMSVTFSSKGGVSCRSRFEAALPLTVSSVPAVDSFKRPCRSQFKVPLPITCIVRCMVYVRDLLAFSFKKLFVSYCVASAYGATIWT